VELKILYFGMIAEATNCREEVISLPFGSQIVQLEKILKNKYQDLQSMPFKIVVNKEISPKNTVLDKFHEIALLPPFAGG